MQDNEFCGPYFRIKDSRTLVKRSNCCHDSDVRHYWTDACCALARRLSSAAFLFLSILAFCSSESELWWGFAVDDGSDGVASDRGTYWWNDGVTVDPGIWWSSVTLGRENCWSDGVTVGRGTLVSRNPFPYPAWVAMVFPDPTEPTWGYLTQSSSVRVRSITWGLCELESALAETFTPSPKVLFLCVPKLSL